jgi:hypothetical protein
MLLKLIIGDYEFRAKTHNEKAPETCKKIKEVLPIVGKAIQARWSGEAAWIQMDSYGIDVPLENQTSYPSKGELLYYPGGKSEKEILIPYGSAKFASKVGLLPGNHFATIIEGLEQIEELGRTVLWNGSQNLRIEELSSS